jgi:hypothetical protein
MTLLRTSQPKERLCRLGADNQPQGRATRLLARSRFGAIGAEMHGSVHSSRTKPRKQVDNCAAICLWLLQTSESVGYLHLGMPNGLLKSKFSKKLRVRYVKWISGWCILPRRVWTVW